MPELPEVETITRSLRPELIGQTILSADIRWAKTLASPTPSEFKKRIKGQKISAVSRRAKFLILQLSTDTILIHLRMSGELAVESGGYQPKKHDRLILTLNPSSVLQGERLGVREKHLVFNDARKFGRVWLTTNPDEVLGKLGPEPLDPAFSSGILFQHLNSHQSRLKPLLLNQNFIAGLGNIYTDEALHLAKLHPLRKSDTITKKEADRLHSAIRRVLEAGIKHNGASIDWVYRGGGFQNHFRVYDRAGSPCPVCRAAIQRIVVAQRGTHFCPNCQILE